MSYDKTNLTLLDGGNGFHNWHYRSLTDGIATVIAAGYFTGDALNMLGENDTMIVETKDYFGLFPVLNAGNRVALGQEMWGDFTDRGKVHLMQYINETDLLAGTSHFVCTPVEGYVSRLTTVVKKAVTTGGTLTVEVETAAVNGLSNVVADAATAGTVITQVPDSPLDPIGHVEAGADIELVGDAAFATAGEVWQIVEITPTLKSDGYGRNVIVSDFIDQTDYDAATSHFIISPVAGQIVRERTVVKAAITTGGTMTVEVGGTAVVGLDTVIANSAGVGVIDTDVPTSLTGATGAVAAWGAIELVGDAAANVGEIWRQIEINPTDDADVKVYVHDFIGETDLLAGTSHFVVAPASGHITKAGVVVKKAVTTGGDLTFELDGVAIAGLSLTIADAATVGTVVTDTPNVALQDDARVVKGQVIELVGDTAFATAGEVWMLLEITPKVN